MRNFKKFTATLLAAGAISAALSAPANARIEAADVYFRVAGIDGGKNVTIYARPNNYSRRVGRLPFNARNILRTGTRRYGRWLRVNYEGQSGWVRGRNLAEDDGGQVYFMVTGVARTGGLKVKSRPDRYSRTRGTIANKTKFVEDLGQCEGNWCLVRYNGLRGWVQKHCLISMRRTNAPRYLSQYDRHESRWQSNYRRYRNNRRYAPNNSYSRYSPKNTYRRYAPTNRWQNRYSRRATRNINTYGYSY